jgi:hypothetical protein
MDGLGRVFNVTPTADATWVSLKDASAVSFLCVGGNNEVYTLSEAKSGAGASSQVLPTLDHYYTNSGAIGATAWARNNAPTSTSTITTTTANPVAVITVHESELDDGFNYVSLASSSTGLVVAILHDLRVQRKPNNLPVLTA